MGREPGPTNFTLQKIIWSDNKTKNGIYCKNIDKHSIKLSKSYLIIVLVLRSLNMVCSWNKFVSSVVAKSRVSMHGCLIHSFLGISPHSQREKLVLVGSVVSVLCVLNKIMIHF